MTDSKNIDSITDDFNNSVSKSWLYFCDEQKNIIPNESVFAENPVLHMKKCEQFNRYFEEECNFDKSLFDSERYDLHEINMRRKSYGLKEIISIQLADKQGNYHSFTNN